MIASTRTPANLGIRRARSEDLGAASLLFESAPLEYTRLAGSERRARQVLSELSATSGHSASFEFAWVAEVATDLAGLVLAFAAVDRLRLHAALVRRGLPRLPPTRWGLLVAGLARLAWLTPRPPADSFFVAAIAVAPAYRRRRIGSLLGATAEAHARERGFGQVAAQRALCQVLAG